MGQKPLSEQIAASVEDIQALLDSNRSLSVAFLSRRLRDFEQEVRERFRALNASEEKRLAALEGAVKKLEERLELASVKFREMREELDGVKKPKK